MTIAVWIVSGITALLFVFAGGVKLLRSREDLKAQMAWVDDFSPWQVKAIGALEVLGAIGLILPVLTGIAPVLTPIAAVGLAVLQLVAAVVHARRKEPQMIGINLVLAALAAFVAVTRFLGY
ncbi:DoxX family protein [Salinibacterium soli]|uniref:DoxX family protein n=1 Tax=Antiquaquibacter soli TaxID=3064523 RepID=A0ABT9BI08_9MICO|nr:DoxX family protein [Protaetiibacter sp. WY-16]MDO7880649.1 DoxX family protein [Protaetiibacter sp. WY-16]